MKRWRVSSAASTDAASCADDRFPKSVSSSYPKRRTASRTPSGSSRAPHAEAGHNDRVRPPFPTQIPPLLSEFLNKRRSKMTFPLKKIEELGLDRPAFTWAINLSYRGPKGGAARPAGSCAQLDAAVYGLWQVRDDCHFAAWRAAGLAGPDVEVLTRIWRREAPDETALAELLPHQRPEDVRASLARLRKGGLVAPDALGTTEPGAQVRQKIEDETDRLFFTPWPEEVGAKGDWIADRLARGNARLAQPGAKRR